MRRVTPAQQHNKKQNTTPWHRQWGLAVGAVGYGPVKFFHPVESQETSDVLGSFHYIKYKGMGYENHPTLI